MRGAVLKLIEVEMYERPNKLRIPFRFGVTTVTHGRQAIVKVRIRLENGIEGEGYAAEALAAKWFDKDLDLSESDNHHQLRKSLEIASQLYIDAPSSTAFSYFSNHYDQQVAACKELALNPLIASYGQSLVDRGIIDALCRTTGTSFYDAVSTNLIGMSANNIAPELSGFDIDRFLGDLRPSGTIEFAILSGCQIRLLLQIYRLMNVSMMDCRKRLKRSWQLTKTGTTRSRSAVMTRRTWSGLKKSLQFSIDRITAILSPLMAMNNIAKRMLSPIFMKKSCRTRPLNVLPLRSCMLSSPSRVARH